MNATFMLRSRNRILTGAAPRWRAKRSANHSSAGLHAPWPSATRPSSSRRSRRSVAAGHHGGAWKVAYADFVTAMMAFFLLMWLINTTSPQQKRGIADYFAPAAVSETTSGSGGILGGAALGNDGVEEHGLEGRHPAAGARRAAERHRRRPEPDHAATSGAQGRTAKADDAALTSAAQSLRQAMQDMPELAELSKQIIVDQTPEGLRIQLVDQEGRSMFNEGSAEPNDRAKVLLRGGRARSSTSCRTGSPSPATPAPTPGGAKPAGDWALSSARADAARASVASRRRRSGPHLPGGRQGRVRPALSGRPAAARQPSDHHRAAARSASAAVRRRALNCGARSHAGRLPRAPNWLLIAEC